MKELLIQFLIICVSSFVLTAILTYFIIPILKGKKVRQHILEVGPRWHSKKEGTPTMGGIGFIIAILVSLLGMSFWYVANGRQSELIPLALTLMLAVLNGMIGFFDDFCKLMKKQNQGLKAYQKSALQLIVAILYIFVMKKCGYIDTTLHIPFADITVELGIVYYLFAILTIVGIVNSVNLTDGIDGLAGSVTFIVFCFFALIGLIKLGDSSTSLLSAALMGGMLGFLLHNLNPARVFMGDTGSLFLGGAVVGTAFMVGSPIIVFIVGGIYLLESVSVILQVGSFKLRNKRIFKMAPIHHHFEKCGWRENKIVAVFGFVTVMLCVIGWFGL
ncbi:MAG: phospho-N-acetylmuramoyl-pentapeptide-transferase [Ruminococcaceae bacterium]|nr:phospho-N-acetylmuramoyl-pentapeptide-transferase [Oscillospiraceae bacterium]